MAKFVALSQSQHADARIRRGAAYRFAANETFLPLVAAELARAVISLPVGFVTREGALSLVAVTSLTPGVNLFIANDGQWLGGYVPAALRGYPFRLARFKDRDESVLVFDEESGMIGTGEGFEEAEPLFAADGTPARPVSATLEFLKQTEINRAATAQAIRGLADSGVIEDWPLLVTAPDGTQKPMTGLQRVSEKKLTQLSDEDFLKLRRCGGLPIAYLQLVSMQHIGGFDRIVQLRDQLERVKAQQKAEPVWEMGDSDEPIF